MISQSNLLWLALHIDIWGTGLPPHEVEKAESSSKNAEESGNKN